MLSVIQSLYDGCLLSMKVGGACGCSHNPSVGLRQGCPLSATLFGIFIDGLHHHLQTTCPEAGVRLQSIRLTDLVYADDICLMASSPAHLQALIDALAAFCDTLHIEINVLKTKVMVVSAVAVSSASFTCNGQSIDVVQSFRYLGLHFHASGNILHVINPLKAKAERAWAVVQQRHSQLQCGDTVCFKLQLLQSILVPSIHYGCELWGMHSPNAAMVNKARTGLEQVYTKLLRRVCGVRRNTPANMLLTELGLSCLKVFWWRRTVQFFNELASSPTDSLYHIILLDNQRDAFQLRVNNFCRSMFQGLASVGYHMSQDIASTSQLDVASIMDLLQDSLQHVTAPDLGCPRVAPSVGVVSCTYHQWFMPFSKHKRYCQLPVSGRRMRRFLQFRLGSHSLPIATGRFAGGRHLARADRVCPHCDGVSIADELHLVFECPALASVRQQYAQLFTADTDSMRSFFGQNAHMQVFQFILDCLDVFEV